ncbi:MAG: hypothetical protein K2N73_12690 [Lachnospiraceae bacterium]|nr:hypothetical protein [Lachnospiraceae bacterium]
MNHTIVSIGYGKKRLSERERKGKPKKSQKDDPEEYLVDFVIERLEIDYNNEPIEDSESDAGFENADAEIELYNTKYVKRIQRKLKRKTPCVRRWWIVSYHQVDREKQPESGTDTDR